MQVKKRKEEGVPPTRGTGLIKQFVKWKTTNKVTRPPKKPKVLITPIVGETSLSTKLPPSPRHRTRKGLMTAKGPVVEQGPTSSAMTRDMPSSNFRPSSRTMIMRT